MRILSIVTGLGSFRLPSVIIVPVIMLHSLGESKFLQCPVRMSETIEIGLGLCHLGTGRIG